MKSSITKFITVTLLAAGLAVAAQAQDASTNTPAKPKADKFYGPVTALDTNAMTFVVNDQTFSVTSKTELTLAKDGSPITLADVTVGEAARGSYTKGDDGKLNVTKVRFGKKSGGAAAGGKSGGKKKKKASSDTDAAAPAAPAAPANPPQN